MTKKSNGPTVADKVRKYAAENPTATAKQIAEALGTKIQYVHSVWYMDRKKRGAARGKIGRPRKVRTLNDLLGSNKKIVHSPLVPTADEIRMQQLEDKVEDLKVVIRYLEGRLYGAPV